MKKSVIVGFLFGILLIGLMGFVLAEENGNSSTCVGEGKSYATGPYPPNSNITIAKCCEGLTAVSVSFVGDTGICATQTDSSMCTKCGNGECGLGENICNCPKDCPSNTTTSKCIGDTDGGLNYYVRGSLNVKCGEAVNGVTPSCGMWVDSCKDEKTLLEYNSCVNGLNPIEYLCPNGCKDGACIKIDNEQCKQDSDCPQVCTACPVNSVGVSCGGCTNYKCSNGKCIIQKTCQPTKCDDGTMTECKESNGLCSCSTCPPIIIKPICGNGVCESGEGEVCVVSATAISCEKGKECKIPKPNCFVVCPQDCKITEGIYANLSEKFKLQVYQSAKIMENNNNVLKITFKDLIAYKCKEAELDSSASKTIEAKVASVTGNIISETTATSVSDITNSQSNSTVTSSSSGVSASGISILKCVGSGPKALLDVDIIVDGKKAKNNIINLEVGEKKQVKDYTIYFSGYDYASKTGTFLVTRETFSCPNGCKCDNNGKIIICSNKTCNEGETLCPDGTCKDKCYIVNPDDCKYGCMYEGKCFPMGVRTSGLYCSDNLVMSSQKVSDEKCENDFECSSNVCVSGKCISEGLMEKIINWFSKLFGGG